MEILSLRAVAWLVLASTAVAVIGSAAVSDVIGYMFGIPWDARHYLFSMTIPAISTPFVVVPLAFAIYRLNRMKCEIERLAHTDFLTGVANRRAYFEVARLTFDHPVHGRRVGLMVIDIDHFKSINDSFGHDVGNCTLQAVARTIEAYVRTDDERRCLVARLGGDEFAVMLTDVDGPELERIAARTCEGVRAIAGPEAVRRAHPTVSIGVGLRSEDESLERALKRADVACYEAKRQGRDQYCMADQGSPPLAPALPAATDEDCAGAPRLRAIARA